MNIAILIFLIINFSLLGFLCFCLVYLIFENRIKAIKRCGVLEKENKDIVSQCNDYCKRLEDYKKKLPLKAKYKLNEKVICVIKDKVIEGVVKAVILYEKEVVEYQIEVLNNKDKTISNTITILEGYVYPGNTLKV